MEFTEFENFERSFIITYNYPMRYRGTYLVKAKDGIEAGNKCQKFLEKKYGYAPQQCSVVMEVYDNNLIVIG